MNKLLKKISWKTRKWNLKINILDIFLHDGHSSWGFNLFEIVHKHISYSLLSIQFRFPNGAEVKSFTIDHFDFLFLQHRIWIYWDTLDDRKMWSNNLSTFETIMHKTLSKFLK